MANFIKVGNNILTSNGSPVKTSAVDVSDTTAVAGDVASGKVFHLADGSKSVGTASGTFNVTPYIIKSREPFSGAVFPQGDKIIDLPNYTGSYYSNLFYNATINAGTLTVNIPKCVSCGSMFESAKGVDTLILNTSEKCTNIERVLQYSSVKYFEIANMKNVTSLYAWGESSSLLSVKGFDLTSVSSSPSMPDAQGLRSFRGVENTCSVSWNLGRCLRWADPADDVNNSLVSIANMLRGDVSSKTLKLVSSGTNPYGRTSQITGVVSEKVSNEVTGGISVTVNNSTFISKVSAIGKYTFTYDGTNWTLNSTSVDLTEYGISVTGSPENGNNIVVDYYNFFTMDSSASTTLADFITNTKGWTLASS